MGPLPIKGTFAKSRASDTCELASNALTLERQLDALYRQLTVQSVWNFYKAHAGQRIVILKTTRFTK